MAEFGFQQFGKFLVLAGLFISLIGGLMILLGYMGFFRLPGDLEFGGKNWKVYFPVASCIVISLILTLIFWLISYFKK